VKDRIAIVYGRKGSPIIRILRTDRQKDIYGTSWSFGDGKVYFLKHQSSARWSHVFLFAKLV